MLHYLNIDFTTFNVHSRRGNHCGICRTGRFWNLIVELGPILVTPSYRTLVHHPTISNTSFLAFYELSLRNTFCSKQTSLEKNHLRCRTFISSRNGGLQQESQQKKIIKILRIQILGISSIHESTTAIGSERSC